MNIWHYLGYAIIAVAIMIGVWMVINYPVAYGQNATPNPVTPTPTQTPTPTTPTPNWQFLPQKAYVQPFRPEVGIPESAIPLTAVPQVMPIQQPVVQTQSNILDQFGGITGVLAMLGAAGVYIKTRLLNNTVKENSAQIAKGADVDQSLAKQVYENMPDKGTSIQDKPEIQLEKLSENKEEATKTASKA